MNPSREESSAVRPILSLGRYALFGELAAGGMATVHFGRMSSLGGFNRTVAIKRMRRDIARDPEFVAMFLDEARLTSRIEHPNVVATLDVVAESGEVFLVMEYVRGESLQRLRRASKARRERVPVPVAVSIMGQVLAGLHAAHEAVGEGGVPLGIIHRDVSPQNIMVGEDGISRITDFGIAKAESRLQVTHEGQMKGKLPYMAPEQLRSGASRIDRRVDIFSGAVVLWELLAGKGLFRADHPGETIAKVLSAPIPSLASVRQDVSPALDRVLRRGLARQPDQRFQTAEEFALELEEALDGGPASPRIVGKWVASLAGEVLAQRLKYVREMESTSFSVIEKSLLDQGSPKESPSREPDLSSEPSMDRLRAPSPDEASQPAPPVARRLPPPAVLPVPKPPPPREQPREVDASPQTPVPNDESSMPSMSSVPSMPSMSSVPSMPSMSSAPSMPSMSSAPSMPSVSSAPSMPSMSSAPSATAVPSAAGVPYQHVAQPFSPKPAAVPVSSDLSKPAPFAPPLAPLGEDLDPSFQKNRRLPWFILGGLLGSVALLFVVAAVSSSSWFGESDPSSVDVVEAAPTTVLSNAGARQELDAGKGDTVDRALDGGEAGPENGTRVIPVDSISVQPSASPPVGTVPKVVPRIPGTRPYLPDLP